jgi:hypothetical protein
VRTTWVTYKRMLILEGDPDYPPNSFISSICFQQSSTSPQSATTLNRCVGNKIKRPGIIDHVCSQSDGETAIKEECGTSNKVGSLRG